MKLLERTDLVRSGTLSVQYSHETGHGLGPTIEFYTLVCREAQRAKLGMWRDSAAGDDDKSDPDRFINSPQGLFPVALAPSSSSSQREAVRRFFLFLGRFIGKALQDRRLVDLPLSVTFCKALIGDPLSVADLSLVEPMWARSLTSLAAFVEERAALQHRLDAVTKDSEDTDPEVEEAKAALETLRGKVEDMCLTFTLPGSFELRKGGEDCEVTLDSLDEYIELVLQTALVSSIQLQVDSFLQGFAEYAPTSSLRLFRAEELAMLLSSESDDSTERNWDPAVVERSIVCKHGYDTLSPQVSWLLKGISELSKDDKRLFMRFITGSPRLPLGGFKALTPQLTIVKSVPPTGYVADEMLPTCSTCQVYLKLPAYSTEEILLEKLILAIRDGQEYFALD